MDGTTLNKGVSLVGHCIHPLNVPTLPPWTNEAVRSDVDAYGGTYANNVWDARINTFILNIEGGVDIAISGVRNPAQGAALGTLAGLVAQYCRGRDPTTGLVVGALDTSKQVWSRNEAAERARSVYNGGWEIFYLIKPTVEYRPLAPQRRDPQPQAEPGSQPRPVISGSSTRPTHLQLPKPQGYHPGLAVTASEIASNTRWYTELLRTASRDDLVFPGEADYDSPNCTGRPVSLRPDPERPTPGPPNPVFVWDGEIDMMNQEGHEPARARGWVLSLLGPHEYTAEEEAQALANVASLPGRDVTRPTNAAAAAPTASLASGAVPAPQSAAPVVITAVPTPANPVRAPGDNHFDLRQELVRRGLTILLDKNISSVLRARLPTSEQHGPSTIYISPSAQPTDLPRNALVRRESIRRHTWIAERKGGHVVDDDWLQLCLINGVFVPFGRLE